MKKFGLSRRRNRFVFAHGPRSSDIASEEDISGVFIDGVDVLHHCFAASESDGFVDRYVIGSRGYFIDPDTGSIARMRYRGVVEIRLVGEGVRG